jgi:hypothetical protein
MNTPDPRLTPQEIRALGKLSPAEEALIEWAETIDAVLDGNPRAADRDAFEDELDRNDALCEAFETAGTSRALTSQLRPEACPSHLGDAIRAAIDSESAPRVDSSTSRPLRSPAPRGRRESLLQVGGLLAAVVALVAVLLPGRLLPPTESDPSSNLAANYSDAEVRAALDEMRTAMAMISGAMAGTADVLRSEMHSEVSERLRAPLEDGLRRSVRSIPYLNPDSGNDQHSRNLSPPRMQSEVLEIVNALERTKT